MHVHLVLAHIHAEAYVATGSADLDERHERLRAELLLAAHALAGAAAAGETLTGFVMLDDKQRWTALRHMKIPLALRSGCLAVENARAVQVRHQSTEGWDELERMLAAD
ncbi:hypothetical protein ACQP2U_00745 [Nocardia sp. CA-084685]|uniref:hypothetical protein n=1 Tax=Nocardia sp. CA-084685 TaxID=3239970 RepID=UPI003D96A98C